MEVVREVRMHAPGFIEGVAYPGELPGNSIVRIDENNRVVEIVPMNAPAPAEVVVEEAPAPEKDAEGAERMGG